MTIDPIKAVLFDVGGTLDIQQVDPAQAFQATESIQALLREAKILPPELEVTDLLYQHIKSGIQSYRRWSLPRQIELTPTEIWQQFVFPDWETQDPVAWSCLGDLSDQLATWVDRYYVRRQMRPEVPEVLKTLSEQGIRLGIISNTLSWGQVPADLQSYGIEQSFGAIVLSSRYGRRKPDPALFHHAARLLGVPTRHCLYVGDMISRDVLGSRRAGLGAVLKIQHDYTQPSDSSELPEQVPASFGHPDGVIGSLREVLDWVSSDLPPIEPAYGILFDADGVLYSRPRKGQHEAAFLQAGEMPPPQQVLALEELAQRGQISLLEYRRRKVMLYGIDHEERIQSGIEMMKQASEDIIYPEGIAATLATLRQQGYRLAVVSNTSLTLSDKLAYFERGGFGHVWDSIILSTEIGHRKPKPEIYEAALQHLGIPAQRAIFVGHDAKELAGAEAVGIPTIGFRPDPGAKALMTLDDFPELLKVIPQMLAGGGSGAKS
ncbi:MAG: HAD family hydrolase [Cyanophyceae cyanobacterium]